MVWTIKNEFSVWVSENFYYERESERQRGRREVGGGEYTREGEGKVKRKRE